MSDLLKLLGADSEAEAINLVTRANNLLNSAKLAAGVEDTAQLVAAIRDNKALATAVTELTGKSPKEAHGVVLAWKSCADELPAVREQLASLQEKNQQHELESLLRDAKAQSKHTPALETTIREQVTAGNLTLDGARAMVAALPKQAALSPAENKTQAAVNTETATTWNGKTYADLKPAERAELKKSDPELFAQLRAANAA